MRRINKKLFSLFLVLIMIVLMSGLVEAKTEGLKGSVAGTSYDAYLYVSPRDVETRLTAEPESSSEPSAYVRLNGGVYDSSGSRLATISDEGVRTCYSFWSIHSDIVAKAIISYIVDGYNIGTLNTPA